MPKGGEEERDRERERDFADMLQALAEFEAGFRRSRKGNLWRDFEGTTLTVFRRPGSHRYCWLISNKDGGKSFSPGWYETEEEAMGGLWKAVGGGV